MVGNTEVGIEMKFKDARYPVLIGATHVPELNKVRLSFAFQSGARYFCLLTGLDTNVY